MTSDAVPGDE